MVAKNDITGDSIQTKGVSNSYRDNYDLIWGNKDKKSFEDAVAEDEAFEAIDNTGTSKNEYYDVLTTEDALSKE